MKKLFIIIPSNRYQKIPQKTVNIIEKSKTPTVFVKQNLPPFYNKHPYITEIISHQTGVSRARNLGIKYAIKHGAKILAFTDDDCIITKNWIKNINKTFTNPNVDVVFGRTLPYQPQKHLDFYCPCTFSKKNKKTILNPTSIVENVGTGNNFAITSKLIKKVGLFSTALGPNTKIPGSEDIDYFIRIIKNNFPTYYQNKALIYHNKWLSKKELFSLYQKYTFAITYVYCYHTFHTNIQYFKILLNLFIKDFLYYFTYLKQITHPLSFIKLIINHTKIICSYFKGFFYFLTYHHN